MYKDCYSYQIYEIKSNYYGIFQRKNCYLVLNQTKKESPRLRLSEGFLTKGYMLGH